MTERENEGGDEKGERGEERRGVKGRGECRAVLHCRRALWGGVRLCVCACVCVFSTGRWRPTQAGNPVEMPSVFTGNSV